jgi:hypothetical protein
MTASSADRERLAAVHDSLPARLNAGILMGDGGFCILGWMLLCAGFHPITMYANTIAVVEPERGGHAVDVVAREYGIERDEVIALAKVNDATPIDARTDAVRAKLAALMEARE